MNQAFRDLFQAEQKYLLESGWRHLYSGVWEEPRAEDPSYAGDKVFYHTHAVNSQKARDKKHMTIDEEFYLLSLDTPE